MLNTSKDYGRCIHLSFPSFEMDEIVVLIVWLCTHGQFLHAPMRPSGLFHTCVSFVLVDFLIVFQS